MILDLKQACLPIASCGRADREASVRQLNGRLQYLQQDGSWQANSVQQGILLLQAFNGQAFSLMLLSCAILVNQAGFCSNV